MKTLIKINNHFYVVDNSKIKVGNYVIGTSFPDKPIGKVINKYGEEFTAESNNGNKHGLATYDSMKMTHSTEPLEGVKLLSLSEVEELVYGYNLEEMARTR